MKRFVEGEDRRQATLVPACLDDYVASDNPVRIIEAFVDELDLAAGQVREHFLIHFGLQEWTQKELITTRLAAFKDDFGPVQFALGQKPANMAGLAAGRACNFHRVGAGCAHCKA